MAVFAKKHLVALYNLSSLPHMAVFAKKHLVALYNLSSLPRMAVFAIAIDCMKRA